VAVEPGRRLETATLMWRVSTLASCLKASSLIWLSDFIGYPCGDVLTRLSTLGPGDTQPHHMLG
jgi:hypothetical protein